MSSHLLQSLCRSASHQLLTSYNLDVKQQQQQQRMVHDMTQEERKEREKKLDDGFFEGFSATLDRHERIQAERRQKDDEEIDEETSGGRMSWQQVSATVNSYTVTDVTEATELEEIYRALIRTVHYRIGATDKSVTTNLHAYMQKVISVSDEQHSIWMDAEMQEAMPPRTLLRVSVKKGKKLPAKDSNDLSDPFCVFGLVEFPPNYLDGKSKTKKLKKLVKDESQLRQTRVIEKTLNPEWNETFNIDIDQSTIHKKVLQIDIWDSDENVGSVKDAVKANVESVTGFFRFVGQLGETALHGAKPDFMGHVFIPLREVSEQGVEQWYPVLNRKQRKLHGGGGLLIGLRFVAQQTVPIRSASFTDAFSRQVKIHQLFWKHENQEYTEGGGIKWNMQLSPPAARLLHLHASQHDLTPLEEAIIDWIVVAEHHESNDVDYDFMINVANKLQQEFETALLKADNPRDVLDPVKIQIFISSCEQFHEWCFRALSKLRVVYPAKHKKSLGRLSAVLRCLQKMYSFPIMNHELDESLPQFISRAVEKSTADWFERQEAIFEPQVKTADAEIQAFVNLALAVLVDLSHAVKVYSQMMKPLGVDYVPLVFKHLDSLLSPNIEAKMKKYNKTLEAMDIESDGFKTLSTASFELYLALKEICKYKLNLPAEVVSDVQLFTKMHVWFKPLVARWIELASVKAVNQIDRAIELDEKKRMSDEALYSTSAIDTVQCLLQVCLFWKSLEWPVPSAAFAFVVNLTDVVCSGAHHYAKRLEGILEKTGYYDDEGQFDVTEQLCVTLNDIHYVETSLASLTDSLGWDKVIEAIGLENGEAGKEQTRASLVRVVASTEEDLTGKRDAIVRTIGQKMGVDIHTYSLPLVSSPGNVPVETSITGLMDYLASNLNTLNTNLVIEVFKSVLFEIYRISIGKILDIVTDKYNLTQAVCERLEKAIQIIMQFFYSNGNGLRQEEIETDQFKQLESILSLRKKESSDLIGRYMFELAEEQERRRVVERGTLTVQMGFIAPRRSLCIKVLNCRNLPVMDPTGSSDPFVTLEPFPHHLFQDTSVAVQKTTVQKETTSPLFDEAFSIPCEASSLTVEGASILFTCYDWDRFTKDDLIGEAVCLLSEANTVDSEAEVDRLKQIMLPLSLPSEPKDRQSPYNILQSRTWDRVATDFIKMRKKMFKMADHERK